MIPRKALQRKLKMQQQLSHTACPSFFRKFKPQMRGGKRANPRRPEQNLMNHGKISMIHPTMSEELTRIRRLLHNNTGKTPKESRQESRSNAKK